MKSAKKIGSILIAILLAGNVTFAQTTNQKSSVTNAKETKMNTYLIERTVPGAGKLTNEQLENISVKSCSTIKGIGPAIEWDHSYVVGDKIYCVYRAANEDLIREHGKEGGFPVDTIYQVMAIISPASAQGDIQNTK